MEPGTIDSPAVIPSIHLYVSKGVIWLLLATVAGIVPTVSPAGLSYISSLFSFDVQVFACLNLNGTLYSLV